MSNGEIKKRFLNRYVEKKKSTPKTIGSFIRMLHNTDKRTDVWSQDFIIWKINSGLWAVVWAGQWEKRFWADYEQVLRPVFSLFRGQKKLLNFF